MAPGPIIAHTPAQFRAALDAAVLTGTPLLVLTAPGAIAHAGALYLLEMATAARAAAGETPARIAIDCGDAPGLALGALRAGWRDIVLDAEDSVRDRVADIAGQYGARLLPRPAEPALNLAAADDPAAACVNWARGVALAGEPGYPGADQGNTTSKRARAARKP
jgi:hypothetical protein